MAFSTRHLGEYRTEIKLDIYDSSGTRWSNDQLDRCIQRAVDDLSRFYPLEAVYEHTIVQDVTAEHWTASGADRGFVALGYKPIKPGSETVTDSSGNACTRDTDYTIDYINGRIAHHAGGEIGSGEADCHITYKKDMLGIDLSAIITNMMRIVHVEYPVARVPQQKVSFNIWNNFMYIGSQKTGESQTQLTDKEHVAIYYEKPHTAPTANAAPSYPAFLDEVICIGAAAYAFLMKAAQYEDHAVTDIAYVDDALDKIATEMGLLDDELGLAAAVWTDEVGHILSGGDTIPNVEDFLESGDNYIPTVNVAADVAEAYRRYAETVYVTMVRPYEQRRADILTEAARYIDKADAWNSEAQSRIANAGLYLEIAMRWRQEGLERRNEFWSILRDKAEWRKRISSTPVRQPA